MAEVSRGPPRVKNKAPAYVHCCYPGRHGHFADALIRPQQISAEQLLREAVDRQEEKLTAPTQRFADLEELHEYQGRKYV